MARKARELSPIKSYTIILKANDDILFNDHDKLLFLETINKYNKVLSYKFLAYNLTDSLLTFVIYDCDTPIDTTMRKIVVSYVSKFNLYHNRKGKVFKDRFVSLPATSIKDVWDMVFDVHNLGNSNFNSASNYFENTYLNLECATQFYGSKENFEIAVINRNNENILKNKIVKTKIKDTELVEYITQEVMPIEQLKALPKNKLQTFIAQIISKTSASCRQIARITSLPLRLLWELNKKNNTEEE